MEGNNFGHYYACYINILNQFSTFFATCITRGLRLQDTIIIWSLFDKNSLSGCGDLAVDPNPSTPVYSIPIEAWHVTCSFAAITQ